MSDNLSNQEQAFNPNLEIKSKDILLTAAKDVAVSAIGKLQETVGKIKPETAHLIGPTVLFGTLATLEWWGLSHAVKDLTPPGGNLIDGINEFVNLSKFIIENAHDPTIIQHGNEKAGLLLAAYAPLTATAFTLGASVCAGAIIREQTRK